MSEQRQRIVVALDLGEYAEIVLEHALDQAARHEAPDLHFLTVVEHDKVDIDDLKSRLAVLVLPALDGLDCTDWRVRLHVREGRAPDEIASLAAEIRAHLIVIGRFGTHHPHRRLGIVASRVIDQAPCPTLVVGLADPSADAAQCPDCVTVRADSDGEQWFCASHVAPDRIRLSALVGPGASVTGGGLMW